MLRRSGFGGLQFCLLVAWAFPLFLNAQPALADDGENALPEIGGIYSPGGWSTLHRGPANRKWVGDVQLASAYETWEVLGGAAVLTAPTLSPDGQTLYVTTGRAAGHSNLHAYTLDGQAVWQSAPWSDPETGVDPCAVLSSVIVDREGDLYLGDCNQLFAYHGDGTLKWVVPLPPVQEGDWVVSEELPVNALTTAAFTLEGDVFGVTNFGDVVVFDRETGAQMNAPMRLPGHVPDESNVMPRPGTVFGDGLLDEAIRDWAWQLLVGGAMPSANTPAVDLSTGRIFVAATSTTDGRGALYGLTVERVQAPASQTPSRVEVEIVLTTEMGPGSGSSPALSPSNDRVYVSDELGRFYGVDSQTGAIDWEAQTKATSAAAAVGPNGDVYALQAYGPALIAISSSGEVLWESDLDALAMDALPETFWLGAPKAIGNGNPTVVADTVLVPVIYGYETKLFGRTVPWPVLSSLVSVGAATGVGRTNIISLPDDSTGITGVLADGTILSSLGTALTSGVIPLSGLASWLLPGEFEPLGAKGGLQVARPVGASVATERSGVEARLAQRSASDRASDASRRPAEVLAFAGIREGMHVAELMAGGGWYAEVLARAVGSSGRVIAQNNSISGERYGDALESRVAESGLAQIETIESELESLEFEEGTLDAVFLVQFYHDTVWMGVDRPEMLRRIRDALSEEGVFVVIDHRAESKSGVDAVKSLHRIEEDVVVAELEAAGFRLEARSSLLANSADDLSTNVFQPSVRGGTDRFLLLFKKASEAGARD